MLLPLKNSFRYISNSATIRRGIPILLGVMAIITFIGFLAIFFSYFTIPLDRGLLHDHVGFLYDHVGFLNNSITFKYSCLVIIILIIIIYFSAFNNTIKSKIETFFNKKINTEVLYVKLFLVSIALLPIDLYYLYNYIFFPIPYILFIITLVTFGFEYTNQKFKLYLMRRTLILFYLSIFSAIVFIPIYF